MSTILSFPLPDGPLIGSEFVATERASKIAAMAHLLTKGGYADHSDSIMVLVASGRFALAEIMMLIVDARAVATQHAVEMEMAWS